MGKNSAINLILDNNHSEILVIINADTVLLNEDAIANLIAPFDDKTVGIVGGRPIPVNSRDTLAGFASNMIWVMHHHISLITPKIGELIAFRDIGIRLPTDMQSDEAIMKMELEKRGYKSVYAPDAVILNRGPETASDFIKQRTRVIVGEEFMRKKYGYSVPAQDIHLIMSANLSTIKDVGVHPFKISFAVMLNIVSKFRARAHIRTEGTDMSVWKRVGSTKDVKKD